MGTGIGLADRVSNQARFRRTTNSGRTERMKHPLQWVARQRDLGLAAFRRGARTAIVMPAMFALRRQGAAATPTSPRSPRSARSRCSCWSTSAGRCATGLQAQAGAGRSSAPSSSASARSPRARPGWLPSRWRSSASRCCSSGVVSSVLAGASTALLLAFILPVTVKAPTSAIPDRLAGWGLASGAGLLAIALLWPAPIARPAARPGCCRLPGAGGPAPQAHRVPAEGPGRPLRGTRSMRRSSRPRTRSPACSRRSWPRRTGRPG